MPVFARLFLVDLRLMSHRRHRLSLKWKKFAPPPSRSMPRSRLPVEAFLQSMAPRLLHLLNVVALAAAIVALAAVVPRSTPSRAATTRWR